MQQSTKFTIIAIIGFSTAAAAVALAIAYGLYLLYILMVVAGILAIRFGVMPIIKQSLDIVEKGLDVGLKIRAARYYTLAMPDVNGNYAQPIDTRGRLLTYIQPGNASASQLASPRPENNYTIEEVEEEEEEILQIAPPDCVDAATVQAPSFKQELEAGKMESGSPFYIGYEVVTDEFTKFSTLQPLLHAHETSLFLLGASAVGKSTLLAGLLARRARVQSNAAFLIFDPHKGSPDRALTVQIMPALAPWLITPKNGQMITGKKASEVRAAVDFLKGEIELRFRDDITSEEKRAISPYYDLDIWVVIDEALSYARQTRVSGHDSAYDELVELMQSIATETAKIGITGVFMAQLGTKEQLGSMEIRDACPGQIVLRVPTDQSKSLGLTGTEARAANRFVNGRGLYKNYGDYRTFVWSYATQEDIAAALEDVTSPLMGGRNKVLHLVSQAETSTHFYQGETSPKQARNEIRNEFPAALQADLDKIEDWRVKLAILEQLIGGDRRDIWQALFKRAPGGAGNSKDVQIYNTLLRAYRFKFHNDQLTEANGGNY